jgi:hypothetical protein
MQNRTYTTIVLKNYYLDIDPSYTSKQEGRRLSEELENRLQKLAVPAGNLSKLGMTLKSNLELQVEKKSADNSDSSKFIYSTWRLMLSVIQSFGNVQSTSSERKWTPILKNSQDFCLKKNGHMSADFEPTEEIREGLPLHK